MLYRIHVPIIVQCQCDCCCLSSKDGQKWFDCNETNKKPYQLNSKPQMWPLGLTLAVTLTLNFQGQMWNSLYLSQNGPIAAKQKASISIELKALNATIGFDLVRDLDLEFLGSNMENHYISAKKGPLANNKYINWTLSLKCDHQIWPWPWPWLWIFKVKSLICCISAKDCHKMTSTHIERPEGLNDHQIRPWPCMTWKGEV